MTASVCALRSAAVRGFEIGVLGSFRNDQIPQPTTARTMTPPAACALDIEIVLSIRRHRPCWATYLNLRRQPVPLTMWRLPKNAACLLLGGFRGTPGTPTTCQ